MIRLSNVKANRPATSAVLLGYTALCLFLISLQSVYFAGGAWLCLAGLAMLLPLVRQVSSARDGLAWWALSSGVIAATVVDALTPESAVAQVASMSALLLIPAVFRGRLAEAATALRIVVGLHLGAIAFQIVWYAATGDYFDFLDRIGTGEQVVYSKKGLELGDSRIPRFAGLQNEPGTYSTLMCAMLAALFSLERRISKLLSVGLVSVFVTMSLGGMVTGAVLLGAILLLARNGTRKTIFTRIAIGGTALAAALLLAFSALEHREQISKGETEESAFFYWLVEEMQITPFGTPLDDLPTFFAFGYFGAGLDMLISTGVYGFSVLVLYVLSSGPVAALLAGVALLGKLKLAYPLLFVLLALIRLGPVQSALPSTPSPRRVYVPRHFRA